MPNAGNRLVKGCFREAMPSDFKGSCMWVSMLMVSMLMVLDVEGKTPCRRCHQASGLPEPGQSGHISKRLVKYCCASDPGMKNDCMTDLRLPVAAFPVVVHAGIAIRLLALWSQHSLGIQPRAWDSLGQGSQASGVRRSSCCGSIQDGVPQALHCGILCLSSHPNVRHQVRGA